ncbi:MAG: DUF433 domain-containing protein [Tepidisphaeraceae bacterium]
MSGPSDKPVDWRDYITFEAGKRSGKPCIRGIRITVGDVLGYLASGMTFAEITDDFPELTREDILASFAYAADCERGLANPRGKASIPAEWMKSS